MLKALLHRNHEYLPFPEVQLDFEGPRKVKLTSPWVELDIEDENQDLDRQRIYSELSRMPLSYVKPRKGLSDHIRKKLSRTRE